MADRPGDADLRGSAARGFAWTVGQALSGRLLSLVGFVVLARLLSPGDYGTVALAAVFAGILQVFAAAGLTQALVQRPTVEKRDLDSTFWYGLLIGAALALVLFASSWPLAAAFDQPQLGPVLRVLSISMLFVALGSTPQAVLMRELRFRANAHSMIAANLVATVAGIAFALLGFGVWSLVVQTILGIGVNAVVTLVLSGYRPSMYASWRRAWRFFNYSRHLAGSGSLDLISTRADDFLIGGVLGPVALGFYTIAFRILTIMNEVLGMTVRQVGYPVFSRLQDDGPRLRRAYSSAARMTALSTVPAFLFLLVTAPEVIPLVFGDQWEKSVPVMQILCLAGPPLVVTVLNGSLLQSVGRARLVFWLTVAGTVLGVVGFAVAVPYGIEWVAAAGVIRGYLLAPLALIYASRELGGGVRANLGGLLAPIGCSLLMAGALFATRAGLADHLPPALLLAAMAVVALVTYGVTLWAFGGGILTEARSYASELIANRRQVPANT